MNKENLRNDKNNLDNNNKNNIDFQFLSDSFTLNSKEPEDISLLQKPINNKKKYSNLSLQNTLLTKLKEYKYISLTLFLFISNLLILLQISNKFYKGIKSLEKEKIIIQDKIFRFNNFSFYFSQLNNIMKIFIILKELVYLFLCKSLYNLIDQRMSVPEFEDKKYLNNIFLYCSFLSVVSILINTFYYYKSNWIFFYNGLIDNGVFFFYFCFILGSCYFSFVSLCTIYDFKNSKKAKNIFYIKKIFIFFLCLNLLIYLLLVLIVSYIIYFLNKRIKIDNKIVLYTIGCNSFIFLFVFSLYMLTFKYDLEYTYHLLNAQPYIDYFVEESEINQIEY